MVGLILFRPPLSGLVTRTCESPPAMYSQCAEIVRIEISRQIRRLLLIAFYSLAIIQLKRIDQFRYSRTEAMLRGIQRENENKHCRESHVLLTNLHEISAYFAVLGYLFFCVGREQVR